MALFGRKKDENMSEAGQQRAQLRQEIKYDKGEPITEVIYCYENQMDNHTFVWKYPGHHFNTKSKLIVRESQEAVFFLNGEALDSFGPGEHTLETQNIPLISSKIFGALTGGAAPFHADVYFINLTEQMAIKWGTDSKVEYMEPTYHFPVKIGACGEMSLKVSDARKLLINLVGTEVLLSRDKLVGYFKAILMTQVKSHIASVMVNDKINIFEIDSHLHQFSEALKALLKDDFDHYGLSLEQFLVTTVLKPDGDPNYDRFKNIFYRNYTDVAEAQLDQQVSMIKAQTEAQKKVLDAQTEAQRIILQSQAMATKRAQEGYTYHDERSFDVADKLAANDMFGNLGGMTMELGAMSGMGAVMGATVAGVASNVIQNVNAAQNIVGNAAAAANPGVQVPSEGMTAKDAAPAAEDENDTQPESGVKAGTPVQPEAHKEDSQPAKAAEAGEEDEFAAFEKKIKKLKIMHDHGAISDEQFEAKMQELMENL